MSASDTARNPTLALSVILITPDTFETVRRTCGYLAAQSIVERLELMLCAPLKAELHADVVRGGGAT